MIRCRQPPVTLVTAVFALVTLPQAALADRFAHTAPLERKPSGNYYLQIDLAPDFSSEFLVDTGSGYVVLTKAAFAAVKGLPGTEHLRDISGRLANGKTARARVYRVARLQLATDCVVRDVEVAVMPGGTRNILGLSALRHVAPFAMELSPPTLLLSDCAAAASPLAAKAGLEPQALADAVTRP